jgi:hypothetical protein
MIDIRAIGTNKFCDIHPMLAFPLKVYVEYGAIAGAYLQLEHIMQLTEAPTYSCG